MFFGQGVVHPRRDQVCGAGYEPAHALTSLGSLLAASCAWRAFSRSCRARSASRSASAASSLASRACIGRRRTTMPRYGRLGSRAAT